MISFFVKSDGIGQKQLKVVATQYNLNYKLDIANKIMGASGSITVSNISNKDALHIPLRLYRMLSVSKINDSNGNKLAFNQQVIGNDEWPVLQTNYIEISLPTPIKPAQSYTFEIDFSGALRGYTETDMLYVKDSIDENFSIVRMDAFAYPLITYPNDSVNRDAKFWLYHYDYDVTFTVPVDYVVANGGELISKTEKKDKVIYRYKNKLPAWRMDFAIARYQVYSKDRYTVFSWESKDSSEKLLDQIVNTVTLYTKWFGPLKHKLGYTFIEVPENYGAQADITSVIQDAVGFKEFDRVYHEISHQWNVKSLDKYSPRWNEGLASFLEELTLELTSRPGQLDVSTEETILELKKVFSNNKKYQSTPFLDYGKEGLNSYSVGMIFFRILYDLMGQDEFNKVIGGFYQKYYESGATSRTFISYLIKHSHADINQLIDEWVNSAEFAKLLEASENYKQILTYYK